MTGPSRIGLPTGEAFGERQWHCPGALLRVTRSDYLGLRQAGQVWTTGDRDIAHEGMSDARAFCRAECAEVGNGYRAGLCSACSELERDNRATLASRAASR